MRVLRARAARIVGSRRPGRRESVLTTLGRNLERTTL
jgi:hypothetical protein